MKPAICPDCHAPLNDKQTCIEQFHMMGFWELDHQLFAVHHLMVLSYYLQHPGSLSMEWLTGAKKQLIAYLEEGVTPQQMRKQIAPEADSGRREYKIKATPDSIAHYDFPVEWTMTVKDVVDGGIDQYYANVEKWAISILDALKQSNNL